MSAGTAAEGASFAHQNVAMVAGITCGVRLLVNPEIILAARGRLQAKEIDAAGRHRQLAVHVVKVLVVAQVVSLAIYSFAIRAGPTAALRRLGPTGWAEARIEIVGVREFGASRHGLLKPIHIVIRLPDRRLEIAVEQGGVHRQQRPLFERFQTQAPVQPRATGGSRFPPLEKRLSTQQFPRHGK